MDSVLNCVNFRRIMLRASVSGTVSHGNALVMGQGDAGEKGGGRPSVKSYLSKSHPAKDFNYSTHRLILVHIKLN